MEEPTQEVEETTLATPSQEQTESEEVTTEESATASDEVAVETEEVKSEEEPVKKRSNRLERRFAKMSQKHREQEEEIRRLSAMQQPIVDTPQVPLDQEITLDQYGQDVARQAKAAASAEIQQIRYEQALKERADNFERDVDYIERKYDILNEDSPNHDSKISSKVASMYEKLSKNNPDVRLKDIVEDVMDIVERQSAHSSAETSASVAKAAAETSIKPDATSGKEPKKDFEELSLREMEEQLGFNN